MYVHTIATFVRIPIDAMQHQPLELLQAFWTYHMKTSNFGSLPTTLQYISSLTQTHFCHLSSSPPQLQYSRKLSREKTFVVLWLFTKIFSVKFGGIVSFGAAKASNLQNFSPRKSPIRESSPSKVSRYMASSVAVQVVPLIL